MLNQTQSNVLIIASMHRSGSSLTAAILQSAGVYIGRKLLSPNVGNIKGHYENQDFYHFHMAVLESQGINSAGWTLQEKIDVEERFVEKAKEIIKKNNLSLIWGWKEPRTTLFLDFWAELLPEAKFIFIYRYPWEVIDSLYRRGDHIFQSQPDMAIKIWLHYNRKILNCYHRFPDRSHLASLNNIIGATDKYIESVNQKLQTNLIYSGANIYEPPLLQQLSLDSYRPSVVAHYFPEAIQMYQELEARAWQPQCEPDFSWLEKINASPYRIWAFQDWTNIRKLETENKALQVQIEQSQSQVHAIQEGNTLSQSQLHATQVKLEQSQSQLQQSEDLLRQYQSQLNQTEDVAAEYQSKRAEIESLLELSQSQLHQAESVLEECHTELKQEQTKVSQLEQYQQKLHHFVNDLRNQLYQLEDVLRGYKTELGEVEVIAVNYNDKYLEAQTKLQEYQADQHEYQNKYLESQAELQKLKEQFETHIDSQEKVINELHQAEALLSEYETHIEKFEAIARNNEDKYLESHTQLQQAQIDANEYQNKYHQSENALHQYQNEIEQLKEQFHTSIKEAEASIKNYQQQLKQTESILTDYQGRYEETQLELQKVRAHLHQNQTELKRYQSEYYHVIEELSRIDQQTKQNGAIITEKQEIIIQLETEKQEIIIQLEAVRNNIQQESEQLELLLQESQSHIDELQQAIEKLLSSKQDDANTSKQKLNKMYQNLVESEIALANYQSQLKASQLEIEQLKSWQTFNDSQVSEGGVSKYKTLVWQAWQAYHGGNYDQMANYLQQSLGHASLSRAQAMIDWIENFSRFASAQGTELDTYSLTNLAQWQQLVRQAVRRSPAKLSILAGGNGMIPK
ncbi:hypothetical protein QUA54_11190 [Microcoleus sp. MOSTC5]|uniref:hypothetical protein n=1 Tax=Microcoleus sp. MOSTC5 TaxID=3055378 RepID=UPI002FCEF10E